MSKIRFQVAYDGPILVGHGMDVYTLGPALLAFGDLIREANAQINGNKSKVNILVTEDLEHKYFNINFEVIQTLVEQVKTLLADEDIKTAKDILEWIGIIGGPAAAGLLAYLKIRSGRKIKSITKMEDEVNGGNVAVRFEGDENNVIVNQNVYQMGENVKIRNAASRTLEPLEREGIDELTFRQDDKIISEIDKQSAKIIKASCMPQEGEEEAFEPQVVTAHLKVLSPVFDPKADRWRFLYGGKSIYVDIAETDIATQAVGRGFVSVDDLYRVKLQITEHRTATGQFRNEYKVLEVIEFVPVMPSIQISFLNGPEQS